MKYYYLTQLDISMFTFNWSNRPVSRKETDGALLSGVYIGISDKANVRL